MLFSFDFKDHKNTARSTAHIQHITHRHCLKKACMSNVHMTCPPPPTQRNHKGWRSAPDAILPGHRKHPSGSRQGHPRYTGARVTVRSWVARHQRHKCQSQDAMTHHPDSPTHMSSDNSRSQKVCMRITREDYHRQEQERAVAKNQIRKLSNLRLKFGLKEGVHLRFREMARLEKSSVSGLPSWFWGVPVRQGGRFCACEILPLFFFFNFLGSEVPFLVHADLRKKSSKRNSTSSTWRALASCSRCAGHRERQRYVRPCANKCSMNDSFFSENTFLRGGWLERRAGDPERSGLFFHLFLQWKRG